MEKNMTICRRYSRAFQLTGSTKVKSFVSLISPPLRVLKTRETSQSLKPSQIHLELTNKCNLFCQKCPVNHGMKRIKVNMSFDLIKKIVSENPHVSVFGLNNWGEPLLHPQFTEIVDYLTNKGKFFFFATNATLLTKELSRHLLSGNLSAIYFSMDGVDGDYERLHGSTYSLIANNIKTFIRLKDEMGKTVKTRIVATINEDSENAFLNLSKRWGDIVPIETQPMLTFSLSSRRGRCHELSGEHVVILSNGRVVPCCADFEGLMTLGDANKNSLADIVSSPAAKRIMQGGSKACQNCSEYKTPLAKKRFRTNELLIRKVGRRAMLCLQKS